MIDLLLLVAQASGNGGGGGGAGGGTAPPPGGGMNMLIALGLAVVFMIFMTWRSNKKERQKQEDMLNSLKRNDRVQTIGGMLGTIVEVRDQEVVIKIDETNNVKARFNRSAIKDVLTDRSGGGEKK
jgi:preprotein translocase subunit YajC